MCSTGSDPASAWHYQPATSIPITLPFWKSMLPGGRQGSQPVLYLQEMRQELADRLTDAVMTHHKSAHPACDPDADPSTCGFDIESCPELPAADKVLPAYLYWSPAAASPPAKAPCTPATSHPRPTPLSSSRKPPTGQSHYTF